MAIYPADGVRRVCSQQRIGGTIVQGSRQPDGAVGFHKLWRVRWKKRSPPINIPGCLRHFSHMGHGVFQKGLCVLHPYPLDIGTDRHAIQLPEQPVQIHFPSAAPHTRTADPSIGLCVTEETSPALMTEACRIIGEGCTHPAFYGDKLITESLLTHGHPIEDARDYIHCCCVEITAAAKSAIWTVSPYHNLLKLLLEVLRESEEAENLDAILAQYAVRLRKMVKDGNDQENRWQAYRAENGGEPLRVSCLIDDCIARGKSVNEGGAVYNQIQPDFLGIFNVVDSLAAVETLVFREKSLTLAELNRILADNFAGAETLRERINTSLPHFGNNEPLTNRLARQITEMIAESCEPLTTFRGSVVNPAAFSYNEHIRHGGETGASPDGRLAGEPLCDGTNPVQGHDTEGPTSMLLSTLAWNHAPFLGGIAVNLELAESQAKPAVIRSLVDSYIAGGGKCGQYLCTISAGPSAVRLYSGSVGSWRKSGFRIV